jgi:hypothetical protein
MIKKSLEKNKRGNSSSRWTRYFWKNFVSQNKTVWPIK